MAIVLTKRGSDDEKRLHGAAAPVLLDHWAVLDHGDELRLRSADGDAATNFVSRKCPGACQRACSQRAGVERRCPQLPPRWRGSWYSRQPPRLFAGACGRCTRTRRQKGAEAGGATPPRGAGPALLTHDIVLMN